jgi:ribosomal protein S18 acetylase RimI-like enzyme
MPQIRASVREATPDDIPAIAAVIRAAYREHAPALGALYQDYLDDLLALDQRFADGTVLVAELDGRVVGTATLYTDARRAGFGSPDGRATGRALAVEPDARGHGVARALVHDVVARAMRGGADELCLHTAEFMTAAVALYEAQGFQRDPAYDRPVTGHLGAGGAEPVTVLAYRMRLTGGRPATVRRLHRVNPQAPWPARRQGGAILTPVWLAGR